MRIEELIEKSGTTISDVAEFLDGLDHAGRMEAMSSTKKRHQKRLWELAEGSEPITLDHFVPEGVPATTEVIHHGRNTLPVLNFFQKRFSRPAADQGSLYGYNEASTKALIGPGYFVAHATAGNPAWQARGAIVVDYFMVPPGDVPPGWPDIKPNSSGLQMFVYNKTRDFMRRVSHHVSIGMAFKVENSLNNWFTLCRED